MAAAGDRSRFDQEMKIINRAVDDFAIERLLGSGRDGLVVAARCTREGIPDDTKLYIVKMLFTFSRDDHTRTGTKMSARSSPSTPIPTSCTCGRSLPTSFATLSMTTYRKICSYPTPLPVGVAKRFASNILEAACFLRQNRIVHLDLKLENVMIAEDGRLVLIDFGEAMQLRSRDMKVVYVEGMLPGGNLAHLAPEVQQRFSDLEDNTRPARIR